jgi:hypothetical protein
MLCQQECGTNLAPSLVFEAAALPGRVAGVHVFFNAARRAT